MQPKLGILAGGGSLPRSLIDAARASGREVFVVAFEGHADLPALQDVPHAVIRLGAAGQTLQALRKADVKELVMAGYIRRPSLRELRPDWRAARFFAKLGLAVLGDDGLLRAVRAELEKEGLPLIGAQDILPQLLTPEGALTKAAPDDAARADIRHGQHILAALSPLDVGQAVVIQQGLVLGIEAIEGTAKLIERAGSLRRSGVGGVLVKLSKIQQDSQMDLPAIGPDTIRQCRAAGLRGLAVEAGRSLLLQMDETLKLADEAGLFIIGIKAAP